MSLKTKQDFLRISHLRLGNISGRFFFGIDRSVEGSSPELTEGARRATGVSSGLPRDNPIYEFPTSSSSPTLSPLAMDDTE